MNLEQMKQGLGSLWDAVSEGWSQLRQSAGSALTRFTTPSATSLPAREEVDDQFYFPAQRWSMLGGDVFEDGQRLIIRLEIPGMEREDLQLQISDRELIVSGEKHFRREGQEGRWRTLQCAYGHFRRVIPLGSMIKTDEVSASYRNGVLRIECPKAESGQLRSFSIPIRD